MKHLMIISSVLFIINRAQAGRYVTSLEKCENAEDYPAKVDFDYDVDSRTASATLNLPMDVEDEQTCNVIIYKKDETGNWQTFAESTSTLSDIKNMYLESTYKKMQDVATPSMDSYSTVSANDYKFDNLILNEEDCTAPSLPPGEFKVQGELLDKDGNPGLCMVIEIHSE